MKDPAVLFYTSDFITGTLTMTDAQRGKYIVLLCLQHQQGYLDEQDMLNICKTYDEKIFSKFDKDALGYFYNKRMLFETEKRSKYSESRRKNRMNICKTYDKHMENENINEDINKDEKKEKNKELRETNFVSEVYQYTEYPIEMLQKFVNYWTEPNKSKTKMRFELEKVFDIKRRLVTWVSRDNSFTKNNDNEFEQLKVKLYGKKPV
jgi:hypothetical protein